MPNFWVHAAARAAGGAAVNVSRDRLDHRLPGAGQIAHAAQGLAAARPHTLTSVGGASGSYVANGDLAAAPFRKREANRAYQAKPKRAKQPGQNKQLAMTKELIGWRILVMISDPWDFVTHNGVEHEGVISSVKWLDVNNRWRISIHLDKPLVSRELRQDVLYAYPRQIGSTLDHIIDGKTVSVNISDVRDEAHAMPSPFNAIGSINISNID